MKKILIIGAGAMGSAFTFPCTDNNHKVTLCEPYSSSLIKKILSKSKCTFAQIGTFSGDHIIFNYGSESILKLRVDKAENFYLNSLEKIIQNG